MFCMKCGAELQDGAKFCTFCGTGTSSGNPSSNSVNFIPKSKEGVTGILELHRQCSLVGSDALRAYKIFIDGKEIGKIKSNETLKIQLAVGNHSIQLKIDWCSSKEMVFSILENQTTYAQCAPVGKGFLSAPSALLNKDGYISITINNPLPVQNVNETVMFDKEVKTKTGNNESVGTENRKFCSNCGGKVSVGARFCAKCGSSLEDRN